MDWQGASPLCISDPAADPPFSMRATHQPHNDIYSYEAPWPVYALAWSQRPATFRLGLGSFMEEYSNKLQILQLAPKTGDQNLVEIGEADHPYPITKLLWSPYKDAGLVPDLLATTGDYLRIWELPGSATDPPDVYPTAHLGQWQRPIVPALSLRATLANVRRIGHSKRDFCAPLTSFDWNEIDTHVIITSSVDTTCTVWDLNTQQAKTQLIAHDKEVYDVAFSGGADVFASVGADGSVRMFDLRALDHSTIIYETTAQQPIPSSGDSDRTLTPLPLHPHPPDAALSLPNPPLLKLSWNKQDPNYIASFQMDSSAIIILDIRVPAVPVMELQAHSATVNSISWAPHTSSRICSAGDDMQALVWDVSQSPAKIITEPLLSYAAKHEINHLSWNIVQPEYVGISAGNTVQALKI
ncbi:hypothetical protein SeLEV6574_g01196 [Synchytrium endobioticum]|uniref:Histone-binding protein RBBP4 N-terminal domain-containing protein n=1 Tax=Synchytrium endobioticum TaxID=286115 RepID=A0A507DE07_9FUNG|nr:hypothetical protein SeLEV6574_g01196 [Synchytrium endobioticum]